MSGELDIDEYLLRIANNLANRYFECFVELC